MSRKEYANRMAATSKPDHVTEPNPQELTQLELIACPVCKVSGDNYCYETIKTGLRRRICRSCSHRWVSNEPAN